MNTDKHGWKPAPAGAAPPIIAIVVAVIGMMFLVSCSKYPSYRNFARRDQNYYAKVAEACDELYFRVSTSGTNQLTLRGNDPSLPPILQELRATKIWAVSTKGGTNYNEGDSISAVSIILGVSREGWGITWEQNDYGNGHLLWELSAGNEGQDTNLFSTAKPAWRRNQPSEEKTK